MNFLKLLWRKLMSLYIGNNASEKVLHVYTGSTGIQKDNFSGTSFHSSLPYIQLHSVHRFVPSGTEINASQGAVTAYKMNYVSSTSVPEGNSEGNSEGNYSIIVRGRYNGIDYTFPTAHGDGYFNNIAGSYYGSPHANAPAFRLTSANAGYTARCGYGDAGIPPATMFGVAIFDYIDVYVLQELPSIITASDIKISKNAFTINGVDILENNYVHLMDNIDQRLNDYDLIIPIPYGGSFRAYGYCTSTSNLSHTGTESYSYMQIINSYDYPIQSVELESQPSRISTYKNDVKIVEFSEDKAIRTSFADLPDVSIHNAGTVYNSGTTYLGYCTMGATSGSVTVINYRLAGALYMPADLYIPVPRTHGLTVRLYAGHYQDVYGIVDTSTNKINFYIRNYTRGQIQSSATLDIYPYELS